LLKKAARTATDPQTVVGRLAGPQALWEAVIAGKAHALPGPRSRSALQSAVCAECYIMHPADGNGREGNVGAESERLAIRRRIAVSAFRCRKLSGTASDDARFRRHRIN